MASLNVNSLNNLYFTNQYGNMNVDKIAKLPILKDEIFSMKSRLKGAYLYEKDCLTDIYVRGLMDKPTYFRRISEISKQYLKKFQQLGVDVR